MQLRWFGPRLLRPAAIRSYFAQLRALQRRGTRIIWTIHNLIPHECEEPDAELALLMRLAETVDACIVHSESAREEVLAVIAAAHGSSSPMAKEPHVIPHGNYIGCYQPARAREEERARLGIAEDETVFAFVGQIRAYKNADGLALAFRAAGLPRARLSFAAARAETPSIAPCVMPVAMIRGSTIVQSSSRTANWQQRFSRAM